MKLTPRNSWKLLAALFVSALIPSASWSQQSVDPRSNLLTNGDFKKGMDGWTFQSWAKQGEATVVKPEDVMVDSLKPRATDQPAPDPADIRDGKPSLKINNMNFDDCAVRQKVTVKPATRYRLAGWVKTKGVEAKNMAAKKPVGAFLCLMGGFQTSDSVIRTKGWTYVTYDFSSGTRSEVEVMVRIGLYDARVRGTAWFSDISLVEAGH